MKHTQPGHTTIEEAVAAFASRTTAEQQELLAHLSHELTLLMRDTYEAGQDGLTDAPRARRINEIQHRVSAHLLKLMSDDKQRYPDDILMQIILNHPDDSTLEQQLNKTFARIVTQHELVT